MSDRVSVGTAVDTAVDPSVRSQASIEYNTFLRDASPYRSIEADMTDRPFYAIYLAVSCQAGGPGGYATTLVNQKRVERTLSGGRRCTIPNRLGLIALAEAFEFLQRPSAIAVYTNVPGIVDVQSPKILVGEADGWGRTTGKLNSKADLYERLCPELRRHRVRIVIVSREHNRAILPLSILQYVDAAFRRAQQSKKESNLTADVPYETTRNER